MNTGTAGFTDIFGARAATPMRALRGRIVTVGNCFAAQVANGFARAPSIKQRFEVGAVRLHLGPLTAPESVALLGDATHVFAQDIGEVDRAQLARLVSPAARIWWFPGVVMRSIWPFDTDDGPKDPVQQLVKTEKFRHGDRALAKLREIEPDKKKRIRRYRELDLGFPYDIMRTIETQKRFLHSVDERLDIKLGRFITRNYRDRVLFHNASHPSEILFAALCEECWRNLDLPGECPPFSGLDGWKDWRVPVHPEVAKLLGLTWAHEKTRYKYITVGEVTWEEWVEAYIDTLG
jgi:hypothetical protein